MMIMLKKETIIVSLLFALFSINIFLVLNQEKPPQSDIGREISALIPRNAVGLLTLNGPISMANTGSVWSPSNFQSMVQDIKSFEENNAIRALIVRINSPGGTVAASQELYQALATLKNNRNIPVVISIGDVGASGGYWVALAGDTIFANPGSMVGSIGVIMQNFDFSEILKKYNITPNTFKSGQHKDLMSSYRKLDSSDTRILQGMVDDVHEQFVAVLLERRDITVSDATTIADGRVYTGRQAKENGLIDELGSLDDAINFAAQAAGIIGEPTVVTKTQYPIQQLVNLWSSYMKRLTTVSIELPFSNQTLPQ